MERNDKFQRKWKNFREWFYFREFEIYVKMDVFKTEDCECVTEWEPFENSRKLMLHPLHTAGR